jgi:hypothetical protein
MSSLLKKLEQKYYQPQKCKGCMWGNWAGTVQFCSKAKCVKVNNEVIECGIDRLL